MLWLQELIEQTALAYIAGHYDQRQAESGSYQRLVANYAARCLSRIPRRRDLADGMGSAKWFP